MVLRRDTPTAISSVSSSDDLLPNRREDDAIEVDTGWIRETKQDDNLGSRDRDINMAENFIVVCIDECSKARGTGATFSWLWCGCGCFEEDGGEEAARRWSWSVRCCRVTEVRTWAAHAVRLPPKQKKKAKSNDHDANNDNGKDSQLVVAVTCS